ncbi:hypothetical protein Ddye_028734 [Dipteronia dyeriana]|uniref:UFSP1/2/DUB catalytic domain-containing protein n=1 Tax=Dipteronia dyeriana TaxID=168575 RepID=A0AAD9TDV9_9ROSI|nr:hypothetical protein Ddye_028734 [Dipteronia dyeriana]
MCVGYKYRANPIIQRDADVVGNCKELCVIFSNRPYICRGRKGAFMDTSTCPFCHLTFPLLQLQSHANSHFDDDRQFNNQMATDLRLPPKFNSEEETCESSGGIDEKVSFLIGSQVRSNFYHVNDGLMSLLRKSLELEPDNNSLTYLSSGYIDHFQSIVSEDVGWGCGWRNIQMLASYLLSKRQDARDFLFGGSGFVPDISSLQRWLEIAWEKGFDTIGSHHFNKTVYGSRKWIGTTEFAALFRSFGFRARIVDFGPKNLESLFLSLPTTSSGAHVKRKPLKFYGPMDRYLIARKHEHDVPQPGSMSQCSDTFGGESTSDTKNGCGTMSEGHQILMDWVWNYFSERTSTVSGHGRVIISDRSPLYFQHDGHSRTIVGIQVKNQQNRIRQYNLLILDPGHRTVALERSLKENIGWKKLLKRGVHTLKKSQYQLCYIDPGIASGEEKEQLKTIDSTFITL